MNFLKLKEIDLVSSKERVARSCPCCSSSQILSSPAVLMPFIADRVFGWKPVTIDETWGLRTIPYGHAYTLCSSKFCQICKFLFLDIRFDDKEMHRLYSGYRDENYTQLREYYEPGYRSRNEILNAEISYSDQVEPFIERFLNRCDSILDWGGASGFNTPFKSRAKYHYVYDISGQPVVEGVKALSKEDTLRHSYDLIVCSEVLEHIPFPIEMLKEIKKRMSEDTLLYIEVPFEEIMRADVETALIKKRHWHEHINFFSLDSLAFLIHSVGMKVLSIEEKRIIYAGSEVFLIQAMAVVE